MRDLYLSATAQRQAPNLLFGCYDLVRFTLLITTGAPVRASLKIPSEKFRESRDLNPGLLYEKHEWYRCRDLKLGVRYPTDDETPS